MCKKFFLNKLLFSYIEVHLKNLNMVKKFWKVKLSFILDSLHVE